MSWIGTITNAGAALLSQLPGGLHTLTLTRASIGTGTVPNISLKTQTAISGEKTDVSIKGQKSITNGIKLQIRVAPATDLVGAYTGKQIGVWGKLDSGTETLIVIVQDTTGIDVPLASVNPEFLFDLYIPIVTSNADSIVVTCDTSVFVSAADFETYKAATENQTNAFKESLIVPVIHGSKCSVDLELGDLVWLEESTVLGPDYVTPLPDGIYEVRDTIYANTTITYSKLRNTEDTNYTRGGALNYIKAYAVDKYKDIADNLTTNDPLKVLSAKQGKVLNDKITNITPTVMGSNENSSHNWILTRAGNLYHLHYERLTEVSNTSQVHTISTDYAPGSTVHAFCYYKQTSGYAKVRMNVYSTGNITLTAETYNEPVAGVFDAYWTKS